MLAGISNNNKLTCDTCHCRTSSSDIQRREARGLSIVSSEQVGVSVPPPLASRHIRRWRWPQTFCVLPPTLGLNACAATAAWEKEGRKAWVWVWGFVENRSIERQARRARRQSGQINSPLEGATASWRPDGQTDGQTVGPTGADPPKLPPGPQPPLWQGSSPPPSSPTRCRLPAAATPITGGDGGLTGRQAWRAPVLSVDDRLTPRAGGWDQFVKVTLA